MIYISTGFLEIKLYILNKDSIESVYEKNVFRFFKFEKIGIKADKLRRFRFYK